MIARAITYFEQPRILVCDGNCHKAWGQSQRPKVQLSENEDDFAFLADHELAEAPAHPDTYEGWDSKPQCLSERLNKWCARECERSVIVQANEDFSLPDFSKRWFNIASMEVEE